MQQTALELCVHGTGDARDRDLPGGLTHLPSNLLRVPAVKQATNYSCGNAATLALLRYWRWDQYARVDEAELYRPLETSSARGTEPEPIAAFVGTIPGMTASYRHDDVTVADLERAVDAGQPPIVDLQAWRDQNDPWPLVWDAGHYVVMVGYDTDRLYFMDPSTMTPGAYAYLPRAEFDDRWHDLAGDKDERVRRMAIFVQSAVAPRNDDVPQLYASRLE